MRSLVIIEVEHGDTTDPLAQILHKINNDSVHQAVWGYEVTDSTVRVDLPECFRLDSNA